MEGTRRDAPTGVLSDFIASLTFDSLPAQVVAETKRIILDSAGCALAGVSVDKGKVAIELARDQGGRPEATILAVGDMVSSTGAAFANGELMNALDFDPFLVPSHVSPCVIPTALALAEREVATGKDLVVAVAVAHEIAARVGASLRGLREGKTYPPPSFGLGACVFGAAAGASKVLGFDRDATANCLGVAGSFTPLPVGSKWQSLPYTPMTKYTSAGWVAQCGVSGALLAAKGYIGDTSFLDGELGFWRMYGSDICRWERMTEDLGKQWLMMKTTYKPYPAAGLVIPMLEAFDKVMTENALTPEEIEKVTVRGEPMALLPMYTTRNLRSHMDAQFNTFYSIAMIAYRVRTCDWQDHSTMTDPRIMEFMKKVSFEVYPRFEETRKEEMARGLTYIVRRPAAAEVVARGKVFKGAVEYTRWGPSDVPEMRTPDAELVAKFRTNASKMLPSTGIDRAIEYMLALEEQDDVADMAELLSL